MMRTRQRGTRCSRRAQWSLTALFIVRAGDISVRESGARERQDRGGDKRDIDHRLRRVRDNGSGWSRQNLP